MPLISSGYTDHIVYITPGVWRQHHLVEILFSNRFNMFFKIGIKIDIISNNQTPELFFLIICDIQAIDTDHIPGQRPGIPAGNLDLQGIDSLF